MVKSNWLQLSAFALCSLLWASTIGILAAQDAEKPLRELFVPFEELDVLLGSDARRVYMTRAEYEELLIKARVEPDKQPPEKIALLVANYQVDVGEGRATIRGELQLEVLDMGVQSLVLPFLGIGVRTAMLDDVPASLAKNDQGQTRLFVEGIGKHRLTLDLVMPIATDAAQQSLQFQIPTGPTGELNLTVPGNIEIKSGAAVVSREVDEVGGTTKFKILPSAAPMSMVMSLNNRKIRDQSTVVARGVVIAEVTQAYERLHATMSMAVLNGAVDEFRFAIDDDLEVNSVTSELLSRWSIDKVDGKQQLVVTLRTSTTERTVVNLRLDRMSRKLDAWQMPKFEPVGVAGYSSVLGLLAEDRLNVSAIEPATLIAIDSTLLTAALPSSLLAAEPGAPKLNAIAAYYAPESKYSLTAQFAVKEPRLVVSANTLLTVSDRGLETDGGFTLMPQNEKLFFFEFECPADWTIKWVKTAEQLSLKFDRFPVPDAIAAQLVRVRVSLPSGVAPGNQQGIQFQAQHTPDNWLTKWSAQSFALPNFRVLNTENQFGGIAVVLQDDLLLTPETTDGLLVMNADEKGRFQLAEYDTAVAYRFESAEWKATMNVSRTAPRSVAQVLSFFQITPDALTSHAEIAYDIKQARAQSVAFTLPESTPNEVSIRGIGGTTVKETSNTIVDGRRVWTVQLAERKSGIVRLAIDFTQPLNSEKSTEATLPIARGQNVDYQSGTVAVEGHPELEIEMTQNPRAVDIGELVDAEYQVGNRLIGVFGYVGIVDTAIAKITRRPVHRLPTTIVERAELVTSVSVHGASQTAARFKLRTKAAYIESRMPADTELWSVLLDGKPALPQRERDRILIALPPNKLLASRDLQLVFESPTNEVFLRGEIDVLAPVLFEREDVESENTLIPIADLKWDLFLPHGYRVAVVDGNLQAGGVGESQFTFDWMLNWLWEIGGGRKQRTNPFSRAPSAQSERPMSGQTLGRESLPPNRRDDLKSIMGGMGREGGANGMVGGGMSGMMGGADPFAKTDGQVAVESLESGQNANDQMFGALDGQGSEGRGSEGKGSEGKDPSSGAGNGAILPTPIKSKHWAMEGVRSLSINLDNQTSGQSLSVNSLGMDPRSRVTIVHQTRLNWLAIAVGLAIFVIGLIIVPARRVSRVRYFFVIGLLAGLAPPVTGWTVELEPVTVAAMVALIGLAATLMLFELSNRLTASIAKRVKSLNGDAQPQLASSNSVTTLVLCIASVCSMQSSVEAQSDAASADSAPGQVITSVEQFSRLFNSLSEGGKVILPADAVVIPFDATQPDKLKESNKLLVPYDKYVELWNRANPEKRIVASSLPANFAWSAANYSLTLDGNESLRMLGTLVIDQYSDKEIAIPLALSGCVIESATLDGKPPRLQMLSAQPQSAIQDAGQVPAQPAPPTSLYVLYTQSRGRKQLELQLRWQLDKRSGWRAIEGQLPATPASELTISVPKSKTEVRLAGSFDRGNFESVAENEKIVTTLANDGRLSLNWRDKITEATVDQGLTVQTRSVFDIQEDALKLAWYGQFEFRRGRRESFTLHVPKDYLVEKVVGANIRGWTVKATDTVQQVDVELLKAVTDCETIIVFISKQTAMDSQSTTEVTVPQITVPEAMLHQGHVAVRRSVLLDVRAEATTGLTRMESVDESAWLSPHEIAGVLPIKVYQAYRYSQVPFDVKLSVSAVQSKVRVQSQTLLKISQLERTLETRLLISGGDRPIYRVQVALPTEWKLQTPEVPGSFQWSLSPSGDRQLIQIYLANGLTNEFPVILRGKISSETQANVPIPIPQIEVIDAQRQSGAIVVQADPAYDVRAENLQGCEPALLDSVKTWLANKQREVARNVVRFEAPQYSGQLQVTSRTPVVTSYSVTNVKVTDRAIEETLFIEANIRSAGIREFVFQMPASMANAKIQAPHVRQKIIQPLVDAIGSIRVQLLLQDEIMGQFRVVVEHDRELTSGPHTAPLPIIETGSTDRRLVTLENIGRDELVTGQLKSFESLDRSQLQQRFQADLLGGRSSQAYIAKEDAGDPLLTYSTKTRSVLTTAGARIGLAQTLLVVDELGTYRATQEYRVENRTEPFLEVELPEGSRMWTVQVAGEPVKPALPASATSNTQRVRIPLIKTAEGELDYSVVIKYGGQIATPTWFSRVEFPLIHTLNINVELSQVRLRLPESYNWFNFGGTLGRVQTESELQAGWLAYRTRQLTELSQLLGSKGATSDYTKARALNNLSALESTIQQSNTYFSQQANVSEEFRKQLSSNSAALQSAQQQASQVQQGQAVEGRGNRDVLNDLYGSQYNGRALNALGDVGLNFAAPTVVAEGGASKAETLSQQNAWFAQNKLDNPSDAGTRLQIEDKVQAAKPQSQVLQEDLARPLARRSAGSDAVSAGKKMAVPPSQSNESQAARYGRRLQDQNSNRFVPPSQPGQAYEFAPSPAPAAVGGGMGYATGAYGMGGGGGAGQNGPLPQTSPAPSGPSSNQLVDNLQTQNPFSSNAPLVPLMNRDTVNTAYMASLDVELPVRGREYYFTTPRGEVELSAQGVTSRLYQRLYAILAVLAIAVGAWVVYLLCTRLTQTAWGTSAVFSVLLLLGLLSLVQGYLPMYGLMALLAAAVLIVARFEMRAPQAN